MRQLKFRVWDKENNQWLFGYKSAGGFSIFGEVVMLGEFSHIPIEKLNNIEIMQFTGILDRKGKEVYEGDIITARAVLENNTKDFLYKDVYCEVCWSDVNCAFELFELGDNGAMYQIYTDGYGRGDVDTESIEILGNRYETPNLLPKDDL